MPWYCHRSRRHGKTDKAERLLANLEQLKESGEAPEARLENLRQEYSALLAEGEEGIAQIKERVDRGAEACRTRLATTSSELEDLEVRVRVGELDEKKNARRLKKLQRTVERLEKERQGLENLLNAKSSEDLGGFLDIPLKRTPIRLDHIAFRQPMALTLDGTNSGVWDAILNLLSSSWFLVLRIKKRLFKVTL